MARKIFAQLAAGVLVLAASPTLAQGGGAAVPRSAIAQIRCDSPAAEDHRVRTLTQNQLSDLIEYNRRNGKDTWIASDVAGYVVDEDEGETAAVRQLSLGTNHGDKLAFDEPLDAVGVYVFARRTESGVLYVFRVDSNLKLITGVRRFTHQRFVVMPTAEGQKHLNIIFDEWVQVLEMAKQGHKL